MSNYSPGNIILVRYPFTDLSGFKIRPAVIIGAKHPSSDVFLVPLTSQTASLMPGEFVLNDWQSAGLNVKSAVKRGIFTMEENLVIKQVGRISLSDSARLNASLKLWLGL
ncbi:type II toxin-antitoxin system PemK/MazF family toxin [Methylomagnum sp.]